MKKYLLLTIYILSICFINNNIYSQCCAAGNPSSLNCSINGSTGKDILNINFAHIYSVSDTYFNGVENLGKKYKQSDFNFSYLNLTYGISNKLRITADLGYFINKSETISNYNRLTQGIADATLGLIYNTYKSDDKMFDLFQTAKITLPIGQFKQEYDGIVLPIDFQPSSGNYKYNIGLIASKRFEKSDFSLNSTISIEESETIETESTFHKYGNLYNISLSGICNIYQNITGLLQLRAEYREKALSGLKSKNNIYSYIPASGGTLLYISPQINYNINNWNFSAQLSLPIYKNVNGEQLTNKYYFTFGISKSLDFSNNENKVNNITDINNLLNTEFKVSGNCEMCKERIEKVVNENTNVINSDWNTETKILKIYYKSVINIDEIKKSIASVGHDTDIHKAEIDIYNKLPECCLYREEKK